MRVSLIVPAAGLGTRFLESVGSHSRKKISGSSKLLNTLGGEPVLLKTINAFRGLPEICEIIVAISPEMKSEVKSFFSGHADGCVRWVIGGRTRAESVWNALGKTSPDLEWVLVHDGARPLVTERDIRKVLRAAKGWDGVILARKVVPTIKRVLKPDGHIETTVDRSVLYEAETPQMVRRDVLIRAYKNNPDAMIATDEAGLLEVIGARVRVVPHDGWNPKLTTIKDLELAEAMLGKNKEPDFRVGIGFDTHRLVVGRKLWLGGMVIPASKGSLGHSDGDALLHSIADAMLGVIGKGDIGEWFSDRDRRWENMKSSVIVKTVLDEAKKTGWTPYHVDSNIILQTPRLGPYKKQIRTRVARLLDLPIENVSIKARTREGLGPEGEGLAVTCQVVVAMKKV
ncbi:MAG: 2-C-methyl-D-erythritol 2,4-cyclodiphosphate synthase [Candidatus Omnitrophica bacterium ADurb.Bin277]|nr:MAG: 2-C-methyl-D-erythritol 2,4-cyclodiphosphate synthase [Candidatus Omnitrophica bacterium ADurb.Bin277]